MQPCPCHSHLPYKKCCERFHLGVFPEHAIDLMRSRYSAYALSLVNYIIATTHRDSPHYHHNRSLWKKEILAFCKQTLFENLEILYAEEEGNFAIVCFTATLKSGTNDMSFTEKSSFKKEGKKWFYLKGESDTKKFNPPLSK